jgi:aryl-alcohol dehydrogenase-like predicted oxidoreductase
VEYVPLGPTGVKVSRIILGCGNFGGIGSAPAFFGQGESEEEAFRIMDAALDLGINVFDTADAYGGGRSETIIGRWLERRGPAVRDQVLLSTKAFNPVGAMGPNDQGLSRRHLKRQVHASLHRLGVDHADFFLVHEPDPTAPLEETLGALDDLVRQGTIHYLGASNIEAWRLVRAQWLAERHATQRFAWVQNSYSLLDRQPEAELLPALEHLRLGFTPFSPLAGGWLTGKYRRGQQAPSGSRMTLRPEPYAHLQHDRTFDALEALQSAADERGVSMAALALSWLLHHPRVTGVVVGPRSPEQLAPANQALDLSMTPGEHASIGSLFDDVPRPREAR